MNAKNAPSDSEPFTTMPPASRTAAWASEREEREQRHVERALPVGAEALREDGLRRALEPRCSRALLRERLHDVDADDRLLGDRRDVASFCCTSRSIGCAMWLYRYASTDEQRRDRQRDQRQPPVDDEEDDRDADDREHVLGEEDEAVAEEEAHGLQVDRRTGHQLAGLVAVVEAEAQPHELGIEGVADVVLDAECLPARR